MKRVYYHIHPITPVKPLVIGSDHGSIAFNITWPYLVLHFFFQRKLEESFNLIIQLLQEWRTNSMIYQLRNNNMTTIRLFTWDESDNIFNFQCVQPSKIYKDTWISQKVKYKPKLSCLLMNWKLIKNNSWEKKPERDPILCNIHATSFFPSLWFLGKQVVSCRLWGLV